MSGLQSKVGRAVEGRERDERYYRLVLSRYCCKSTALFRPMPLSYFENKIEYALPYGKVIGKGFLHFSFPDHPTPGKITLGKDGMVEQVKISINSLYGDAENSVIKIK